MTINQIEKNIKKLIDGKIEGKEFIYELLLAYGSPKASIKRLKDGNTNLSKKVNEIIWKKKLFFKETYDRDLHLEITELEDQIKYGERFIIVTNFKEFLAIDTKTKDKLDIKFKDLVKHYDFFLPWAGMEKAEYHAENPADVKAAEKMAKLFDEIKKDNPDETPEFIHGLNIFLSRLLFCFFAEDTSIFSKGQFTNVISSHTQTDGSDLDKYLEKLFEVLDTNELDRKDLPKYLEDFPYVNGGLFKEKIKIPKFTKHSRRAVIDSGELDWSAINPDIFGSMFQGVILEDKRGSLGMHYTSVPNIMKVINPLFLDELNEEFESACGDNKKLNKLLIRIRNIKIFDPACGSGNFLIIAYKELRRLEMKILEEITKRQMILTSTGIKLSNFYGIEIDDFAHEIAKLALWLAEHQMHLESFQKFGLKQATLPLKEAGKIVYGNATRLNWEDICPKKVGDEIYILGNPPYLGTRNQKEKHKLDMAYIFEGMKNYKSLDYISCWFFKASKYIKKFTANYAFVTTNSICQGDQVSIFWPLIINENLEISFATQSFKWTNSAKGNAAVTVVIIGIRNINNKPKLLFNSSIKKTVSNINYYLVESENIVLGRRSSSVSGLPKMIKGSIPADGGHLILDKEAYKILSQNLLLLPIIRKFIGAQEFIKNIERWCLYIDEKNKQIVENIPVIRERLNGVIEMRLKSSKKATNILAKTPHLFAEDRHHQKPCIIIPCTTSERRNYIPIGFVDSDPVIYASAQAIYDPKPFIFGIVTSQMHMAWMRTTAGRLKTDYRYSSALVYNTFPFPKITKSQKEELTKCVFKILEEREKHSEKTLGQLYDPDKMPEGLREAHRVNDLAIESCYRAKPFESDEERLEYLFKMYEKMVAKESE
ncbi:MAG: DNA methyltransferase [Psychrilyobacter sp.]|uniref:class I SAM-dependent DNA methyltransferase n=1 Tax=Psychrilyobacter sp. TaxID=2586924 RepID=UPI003C7690D3